MVLVALQSPQLALFLLIPLPAVMLPASLSHLMEGRLRFPLDLFYLPLVPVVVETVVSAFREVRLKKSGDSHSDAP